MKSSGPVHFGYSCLFFSSSYLLPLSVPVSYHLLITSIYTLFLLMQLKTFRKLPLITDKLLNNRPWTSSEHFRFICYSKSGLSYRQRQNPSKNLLYFAHDVRHSPNFKTTNAPGVAREFHSSKYRSQNPSSLSLGSDLSPHSNSRGIRSKVVLTIASLSTAFFGFFLLQAYRVYTIDDSNVDSKGVFLPLWFSMDWPVQRKYPFPEYLRYIDLKHYEHNLDDPECLHKLRDRNIQYQILNKLFQLNVIRDKYGLPLTIHSDEAAGYSMWIEPKHPSLHGVDIRIGKRDGLLWALANWRIRSINLYGDIEGMIADLGSQFDPMVCGEECGLGVAGDVSSIELLPASNISDLAKVAEKCGERNYRVLSEGSYQLRNSANKSVGTLHYIGLIDFTHPGVNCGFRVVYLELRTTENGQTISYKIA